MISATGAGLNEITTTVDAVNSSLGSVSSTMAVRVIASGANGTTITVTSLRAVLEAQDTTLRGLLSGSPPTFGSVIAGQPGAQTAHVRVDVTFSDDSCWNSLFDGRGSGSSSLPGLVTFAPADSSLVSVDNITGGALLLDNSAAVTTIVARAVTPSSTVSASTGAFYCNVQPAEGDVDLGALSDPLSV